MAHSAATLDQRRRHYRFRGRKGFREFVRRHCIITRHQTDVVRRCDLFRAYRRFCSTALHPVASMVNVGRYLGGLKVWASRRLGGSNGRWQEYAYVGIRLQESPSRAPQNGPSSPPTVPLVSPNPPSPPPSSDGHLEDTDASSLSLFSPGVSLTRSEDDLDMLDAFLREHVEHTGSTEDAVAVEELHAAYRRLCRARGVTPPPAASLRNRLTQQKGVVVSHLNFETVKRAYQGLKWTGAALTSLTPSRRPRPTPCDSCEAKWREPAATGSVVEMKDEVGMGAETSGGWSPWVREDEQKDQVLSLKFWDDDDDPEGLLQTLQMASPPPQLPVMSPPPSQDLMLLQGNIDLSHLLEANNSTYPFIF